jgi:hypothetical protein
MCSPSGPWCGSIVAPIVAMRSAVVQACPANEGGLAFALATARSRRSWRLRGWPFSLSVCLLGLLANVTTEQAPAQAPQPLADGLVHSEIALAGHTVTVAFVPALKADDPAHRAVLSRAGSQGTARVRVGQLVTTNGTLRLGTLDLKKADRSGLKYDLWLEATGDGWQLQVAEPSALGSETAGSPAMIGTVALSRQAGVASPTLVAALVPTAADAGQLLLRWGGYEGTADVKFTDPAVRQRPGLQNGARNVGVTRGDEDLSATFRARILTQNNETGMVLPDGKRLSVLFIRSLSQTEQRSQTRAQRNLTGVGLDVGGVDYPRIATTADGAVVMLTEAAVPRLKIEAPLRFGNVTVRTENQAPKFPGMYGIWLKRVGGGWHLVFNNEPDAWGSQHDPKFDVAEIELTHSQGPGASRPFGVALEPTAADRGRLVILWGPHEWSADFVVAS